MPAWQTTAIGVAGVEVAVACLFALLFVLYYAAKSPWRSTALGRTVMWLMVDITLLLGFAVLTWLLRAPLSIRIPIALVLYAGLAVSLGMKFRILRQIQKDPDAVIARDVARRERIAARLLRRRQAAHAHDVQEDREREKRT